MLKNRLMLRTGFVTGILLSFLVLPIVSSVPLMAGAEDEIIWVKRHFPPAFILKGVERGQGIHDATIDLLQQNMPEYTHRTVNANLRRTIRMMVVGQNVCRAGLYKDPDRLNTMHMSIAHILVPPHRVFIKKSQLEKIRPAIEKKEYEQVSIENLIQNHPELTLGIEADRSYGSPIDQVLDRYQGRPNISVRFASDAQGFLKMLLMGRIDYIIEFPPSVLFLLRNDKTALGSLYSLEIAESNHFRPAHIGCSKTAAGKATVNRINAILRNKRATAAYRQNTERWLDENTIPAFRKAYQTVFLAD